MSKNAGESHDDLEKYKSPKEGALDKALGIGRDFVGPLADLFAPGSSGAISLFTEVVKTPYDRSLQQWQEDIGTAVIELSQSRKNIVTN